MKTTFKKLKMSLVLASAISLTLTAQTTRLVFGTDHTTLGNADITVSNNVTTIGKIGSTGDDGVKMTFHNGEYHHDIGPQDYIPGSKITLSIFGKLGTNNEALIGNLYITVNKDNFEILPDFSASAKNNTYNFVLMDKDRNTVANRTGLKGATVVGGTDPLAKWKLVTCSHDKTDGNGNITGHYWSAHFEKVEAATAKVSDYDGYQVPTGEVYNGIYAFFFSEPDPLIKLPSPMTNVSDRFSNTGNVTIEKGWLVKPAASFAYTTPLDERTRFFAGDKDVRVTNDLNATTFTSRIEVLRVVTGGRTINSLINDIDLGSYNSLSNSAELVYNNFGFFGNPRVASQVSKVTISNKGNGIDVFPDFSAVNSPQFTTKGYLNSQLVTTATDESGAEKIKPLAGFSWINTPIKGVGFEENKIIITFSEPVRYKAGSGGYMTIDRIEYTASTPSKSYNALSHMDLTTTNIPSYAFTGGTFNLVTAIGSRLMSTANIKSDVLMMLNDNPLITLFPNPASAGSGFTIKHPAGAKYNVTMYDANGKMVKKSDYQLTNTTDEITVKFESIEAGAYFINLNDGASTTTKKLVITK